jgi:hypothetical protein
MFYNIHKHQQTSTNNTQTSTMTTVIKLPKKPIKHTTKLHKTLCNFCEKMLQLQYLCDIISPVLGN